MKTPTNDWRHPSRREELFLRYFKWRRSVHDLDHSHYCRELTRGYSDDQKAWFSLYFGMTYRTPQAYAYLATFPDVDGVPLRELERWNTENWRRTTYGTDARYNKGYFYRQVASVRARKGRGALLQKVLALTDSADHGENFRRLFDWVGSLYKFGRMTSWITCQCLYDTLGLPIDLEDVFIRSPANDSGMQSVWNGYCILAGREDMLLGRYATTDYRVTPGDLEFVRGEVMRYRRLAEAYAGPVDVFKWESVWCQFKRLFRPVESHEYPGHSSGDAASRYPYYREHWPEIDWAPFRGALLGQPGLVRGRTYVNDYNKVFGRTGLLLNMHEMYSDLPDAYASLGLNPAEDLIPELFRDAGLSPPVFSKGRSR